jgi:ATP-binding cassette subfamily F protein 3
MIVVSGLTKAYGSNVLFESAGFSINSGDRIGLVGRNGHGKSTLIKILAGLEESDEGHINIPKSYSIGYLEQQLKFDNKTILDFACEGLDNEDGLDLSYQAKTILIGLGFNESQFDQLATTLSGGYQVRLNLAKLLVSNPNLLLLDEPTNYLDILSLRWLGRFLRTWPGELVFITHDRDFMDSVTTHTLGIHRGNIIKLSGSTEKYYEFIKTNEELHEKSRVTQQKKRQEAEAFITRFRAQASKAKAVQSRIKALEKEEVLEELNDIASLDFKFPYLEYKGKWALHTKELSFGYNKEQLLIDNLTCSIKAGECIGIIGKNGKGKSTLLRLLGGELNANNGSVELPGNIKLQYFGQTNVERLDANKTIEEEVQSVEPLASRTLVRTICGLMMFSGDQAEKKIKVLSGGEKARVLLAKILIQSGNLLLLDEPTNHLDMESNEALLEAIRNYAGTTLIVTHNERFLKELAKKLIIFDRGNVEFFEGNYEDFLRTRGWQDEEGEVKETKNNNKYAGLSKKEIRKLKADLNLRRTQELKPLQNQITKLETDIIKTEELVASETARLLDITKNGFNEEAADLSRSIAKNKELVEKLFSDLEVASAKFSSLEKEIG